jgi:hypothetical protein
MFAILKRLFVAVAVMVAVVSSIGWLATLHDLDEAWEDITHKEAVLKMASQALSPEQRLRVVDQARLSGDSQKIGALKWEFCSEYPLYRDFEPDADTFTVGLFRGK